MVAKSQMQEISEEAPPAMQVAGAHNSQEIGNNLDRLIHERTRLALVSALAANPVLSFNDLKSLLQMSDGNLSAHARKLEDAGYIACSKSFDGRLPRTEFRLTESGRSALQRYIAHMEALILAMKNL